jgi:hypothetical protein
MAGYQPKTVETDEDVAAHLSSIADEGKRADALALVELMSRITGKPPRLWGSMIGFGRYHYKYASGHEGDSFLTGFAPRKAAFSIYLLGGYPPGEEEAYRRLFASLGKHRMGKGCLYVKRLADIDVEVLEALIEMSVRALMQRYPEREGSGEPGA